LYYSDLNTGQHPDTSSSFQAVLVRSQH